MKFNKNFLTTLFTMIFLFNIYGCTSQKSISVTPTPISTIEPTSTLAPTPVPTIEPTPTAVPTPIPTIEPTPTAVPTPIPTIEPTPTAESTPIPKPTIPPGITPTTAPTPTITPKPTIQPTPTIEPTPTPTQSTTTKLQNTYISFADPDEEFEKFMSSSEASNYVNMETIDKVQDGKIYFNTTRFLKATDPSYSTSTLVPAEYNQDINKETYEIVRDLLKYARQYDGYVNAIYDPSLNGTVTIEYYESSEGEKYKYTLGYNTFGVYISVVPEIDKGIEILYPSEQKEKSFYQWDIGRLCTAHYLIVEQGYRGRNIEEDLTKFDYTEDSHTEPLKSALINIYGENQGTNFFDFVIDVKYKCAVLDNYTDKFIGYKDSIGCQLIYINGEVGSGGMFLKTSKVGEKI